MQATALGLAPHSGWAALVVVAGPPAEPVVLLRDRVEMADLGLAGSKQPYHHVEGWSLPEAKKYLDRLSRSAQSMAKTSLREVLRSLDDQGFRPRKAGILESSGRKGLGLAATLASHALIHTADGDHFRDALEMAGTACGLKVERIGLRGLPERAKKALGRTPDQLAAQVQTLGRPMGPPWGADQKAACLLAWTLLA